VGRVSPDPSNLGVEVAVAEEKTRILTPAEQQNLRMLRPKTTGDKIVFFCKNGHRIVAPLESAGVAGACSKCNVSVKVPAASSPAQPAADGVGSGAPDLTRIVRGEAEVRVAAAKVAPPVTPAVAPPVAPPPAAVAGEAGGSPVPPPPPAGEKAAVLEDAAEGDAADQADLSDGTNDSAAADSPAAASGWNFLGGAEPAAEQPADGDAGWPEPLGENGFAAESDNPAAVLLGRLWEERQHGGLVQVHLKDGGLILPQEYAARWSQGTHAVFASSEADDTITLTAVAWDAIQKIVVRNLKDGLPPGMFD
jgi:hypothetical protein